jgi:hypothetical protein
MSKKFRYVDLFGAKARKGVSEEEPVHVMREIRMDYDIYISHHHSARVVVETKAGVAVVTTHPDEDHQADVLAVRPLTDEDLRPLENPDPPRLAEFLLTALAFSRRAEHAIGDLNEQYAREYREFGAKRAGRRYWAKALQSLAPLLVRAVGKALKWGAVIDMVRRHL